MARRKYRYNSVDLLELLVAATIIFIKAYKAVDRPNANERRQQADREKEQAFQNINCI